MTQALVWTAVDSRSLRAHTIAASQRVAAAAAANASAHVAGGNALADEVL